MSEEDHQDKPDDSKGNIIYFSSLEKKIAPEKKNDDAAQEALWRAQYQAQQARLRSLKVQKMAAGKQPFFNYGYIPLFVKIMVPLIVLIHAGISLMFMDAGDRLALYMTLGFVPASYFNPSNIPLLFISPFLSLFLHSGWMHLAFNVMMLGVMGMISEREFGFRMTAFCFFVSGLIGNLTYLILSPASVVPVVGASGGISGLFVMVMLLSYGRGMMGPLQKTGSLPFLLIWVTIIVLTGFLARDISWQSHLGGFLGGIFIFNLWKQGKLKF